MKVTLKKVVAVINYRTARLYSALFLLARFEIRTRRGFFFLIDYSGISTYADSKRFTAEGAEHAEFFPNDLGVPREYAFQ